MKDSTLVVIDIDIVRYNDILIALTEHELMFDAIEADESYDYYKQGSQIYATLKKLEAAYSEQLNFENDD